MPEIERPKRRPDLDAASALASASRVSRRLRRADGKAIGKECRTNFRTRAGPRRNP